MHHPHFFFLSIHNSFIIIISAQAPCPCEAVTFDVGHTIRSTFPSSSLVPGNSCCGQVCSGSPHPGTGASSHLETTDRVVPMLPSINCQHISRLSGRSNTGLGSITTTSSLTQIGSSSIIALSTGICDSNKPAEFERMNSNQDSRAISKIALESKISETSSASMLNTIIGLSSSSTSFCPNFPIVTNISTPEISKACVKSATTDANLASKDSPLTISKLTASAAPGSPGQVHQQQHLIKPSTSDAPSIQTGAKEFRTGQPWQQVQTYIQR
ncbi:unnamed protein product [Protopolystoma xenopodis]|uniref:Uncharacterized protein n=1 Tax=Protopolystoma xenopodis TaxID=117903 RepID=A0A3S5FBZ7_9PLAT|nr:unnamed protein product [Protopolystoma xenopodis]